MKNQIIADLGTNYKTGDDNVLDTIIEDVSSQALRISNRKDTHALEFEIKEAVKTLYLLRGTEDVKTLTESGRSATYQDAMAKLRRDIITNGKRLIR